MLDIIVALLPNNKIDKIPAYLYHAKHISPTMLFISQKYSFCMCRFKLSLLLNFTEQCIWAVMPLLLKSNLYKKQLLECQSKFNKNKYSLYIKYNNNYEQYNDKKTNMDHAVSKGVHE